MNFPIKGKQVSPWLILMADLLVCTAALGTAYLLRFNFQIPDQESALFPIVFPSVLGVRLLSFLLSGTYKTVIPFIGIRDAQRIFVTIVAGAVLFFAINPICFYFIGVYAVPYSILIIESMLSLLLLLGVRATARLFFNTLQDYGKEKYPVLIVGIGETATTALRTIERDAGTRYKVLAFLTDQKKSVGRKLLGLSIRSLDDAESMVKDKGIKLLILATEGLSAEKRQGLIDIALRHQAKVFAVPPVNKWIKGELSFKQIKKINIQDLLERDPIVLDKAMIGNHLEGRRVLVTGAAGSIGSELVKQCIQFNPAQIILLDHAESPLYEMKRFLEESARFYRFEIALADITRADRMEQLFDTFKPEVILHAAAYKHVPLMEEHPVEAVRVNILGTKILADLAHAKAVKRFVMVSTDKAVNPTNVMGASKRVAELYVQALSQISSTAFVTTRFGNVLGSNGSLIPIIEKQIARGGPVTVTHPEITRFFMTIPEACQLVLEAGALGNGGEIFLFDMGKPVRILELVQKMIQLSGLTPGKDIEIEYTGLRPGEKLHEELLNAEENTIATHHPQILKAKMSTADFHSVQSQIDHLLQGFDTSDDRWIVGQIKQLVPEFISNNSPFEALDRVKT